MKKMKNNSNRRSFIKSSAYLAGTALLAPQLACSPKTGTIVNGNGGGSLKDYGLQLYTLRDVIPADPKGTLKKVSEFGFTQIEGYEGKQGMFWNMAPKDFKMYLDDLGMTMVSSHCNINEDFERKVDQAAEVGMAYLICPWVGPQKTVEAWKDVTDKFNKCGEMCRKAGLRFAYHNHAYTFKAFSGMIPHEFLMENTDPDLVDHEMDIYWVVTGGADPIDYFTRYPGRFRLCHVKDRLKNVGPEVREATCDLGTGSINFPKILKVAADNGMKYFIMEQERYDNSTPLSSAETGAKYLRSLQFA